MSGGILSDGQIQGAIETKTIEIEPYTLDQLNSASYDLTLGDEVRLYKKWVYYDDQKKGPRDGSDISPNNSLYLDTKEEPETVSFKMSKELGWVLKPGIGYLMHTRERIMTRRYVPIVDGKSSIGRLFILVHFTAGFGDPNFDGQYTLEVSAQHPVKVYPGMRIGQIRFHTLEGFVNRLYQGNYTGEAATGAVASRAWRQFR